MYIFFCLFKSKKQDNGQNKNAEQDRRMKSTGSQNNQQKTKKILDDLYNDEVEVEKQLKNARKSLKSNKKKVKVIRTKLKKMMRRR